MAGPPLTNIKPNDLRAIYLEQFDWACIVALQAGIYGWELLNTASIDWALLSGTYKRQPASFTFILSRLSLLACYLSLAFFLQSSIAVNCQVLWSLLAVFEAFTVSLSNAFFCLRACALWRFRPSTMIPLFSLWLLQVSFWLLNVMTLRIQQQNLPVLGLLCLPVKATKLAAVPLSMTLGVEACSLLLIVIKMMRKINAGRLDGWSEALQRELSILHLCMTLPVTLAVSILYWVHDKVVLRTLAVSFVLLIHVILSSRAYIHYYNCSDGTHRRCKQGNPPQERAYLGHPLMTAIGTPLVDHEPDVPPNVAAQREIGQLYAFPRASSSDQRPRPSMSDDKVDSRSRTKKKSKSKSSQSSRNTGRGGRGNLKVIESDGTLASRRARQRQEPIYEDEIDRGRTPLPIHKLATRTSSATLIDRDSTANAKTIYRCASPMSFAPSQKKRPAGQGISPARSDIEAYASARASEDTLGEYLETLTSRAGRLDKAPEGPATSAPAVSAVPPQAYPYYWHPSLPTGGPQGFFMPYGPVPLPPPAWSASDLNALAAGVDLGDPSGSSHSSIDVFTAAFRQNLLNREAALRRATSGTVASTSASADRTAINSPTESPRTSKAGEAFPLSPLTPITPGGGRAALHPYASTRVSGSLDVPGGARDGEGAAIFGEQGTRTPRGPSQLQQRRTPSLPRYRSFGA